MPSPRSLMAPLSLLAVCALGMTALLALDINIAINDSRPTFSSLRADIRQILDITSGAGFIWLGLEFAKAYIRSVVAEAMSGIPKACNTQFLTIEERLERTVPLPRAVGAAHVPTAIAPVDADVIHIAKRVQDRLNGHGNDH